MTSMILSQSQIMTNVNTALLSMNLETVEASGDAFSKMIEQSVSPNLGQTIDIKT